jgi:hypothetical protein
MVENEGTTGFYYKSEQTNMNGLMVTCFFNFQIDDRFCLAIMEIFRKLHIEQTLQLTKPCDCIGA